METLTQKMSQFIFDSKLSDIPPKVVEKAKTCLLYGMGMAITSWNMPLPKRTREWIEKFEPGSDITLIGGGKASLMGAAFVNGVLFSDRGVDDTHGTTHFGSVVIPAALAVSEFTGAGGKDFLLSVILGYEIGAAVSRELTTFSALRGFRSSTIYGILAVTAAMSKLFKYPADRIRDALGIAVSFAGGTTEQYLAGTMEGKVQNAMVVRNGIMAALLPSFGLTGASTSMEGKAGFCHAFAGRLENLGKITEGLGKTYEILNVTFKPYATCVFNQTPVTAMFRLVAKHDLKPENVAKIHIRMNPFDYKYPGIHYLGPFHNKRQGLLSAGFLMALVLVKRKVGLSDDYPLEDPDILSLCQATAITSDARIAPLSCHLTVKLKNSQTVEEVMDIKPEYYNFDLEKVTKMVETVHQEMMVDRRVTREMIQQMTAIETWPNVRKLMELLSLHKEAVK